MPLWTQHTLVLLIAAGAAFVLLRQAFATFRGRGNKLGSCCAKGCDAQLKSQQQSGERLAFLPVESLTRPRRT
jgi:hypothetical protein